MNIKQATIADIPLIHDLAWRIFPETYREILSPCQKDYMMEWMYSESSLKKQITEEHHTYLVGYLNREPIGYVSVQPEAPDTDSGIDRWHLQKIYVLKEYQGMHLGRELFESAIAYIKNVHPGPFRLELNVNRDNRALGFYEHLGMYRLSEGDFPIGNGFYMNDYIMGLDFPDSKQTQ